MHRVAFVTCAIAFLTGASHASALEDVCKMTAPMRPTTEQEAMPHRGCEKTSSSQMDINECQLDLFVLSQVALTKAYNSAVSAIAKNDRPQIEGTRIDLNESFAKSQQAWWAYREAACTFDSESLEGGSMQPGIAFGCRRQRNEARIKALTVLATCYADGDCQQPPLFYMYELFPNERP